MEGDWRACCHETTRLLIKTSSGKGRGGENDSMCEWAHAHMNNLLHKSVCMCVLCARVCVFTVTATCEHGCTSVSTRLSVGATPEGLMWATVIGGGTRVTPARWVEERNVLFWCNFLIIVSPTRCDCFVYWSDGGGFLSLYLSSTVHAFVRLQSALSTH